MVVAGCPKSSKRHAKRACRMALEMKKVFAELRLEMYQILGIRPSVLDIRIGLNSGPIVAGVVGVTNPRCALLLVKDMGCWLGATAAEAVHLLAWRLVWVVDTWCRVGEPRAAFFSPLLTPRFPSSSGPASMGPLCHVVPCPVAACHGVCVGVRVDRLGVTDCVCLCRGRVPGTNCLATP